MKTVGEAALLWIAIVPFLALAILAITWSQNDE